MAQSQRSGGPEVARKADPTYEAASAMPPDASSAQPAGRLVIERPPDGLARGEHAWPAWAIGLLGAAVVAAAVLYLWRSRRSPS